MTSTLEQQIMEFIGEDNKYQDRYLAYCKYKGFSPDSTFNGADFINWLQEGLKDFCNKFGESRPLNEDAHERFTKFLQWKANSRRQKLSYDKFYDKK